jgi:anti-sigma-K factor RskA
VSDALATHVPQVQPPAAALDNLLRAASASQPAARRPAQWQWWLAAAAVLVFIIFNNAFWIARIQPANPALGGIQVVNLPTAQNGETTGALGQVIWIPETGQALLIVEKFPEQSGDMVYQAWVTRGKQITSLGLFDVNPAGSGSLVFDTTMLAENFDAIGVTREPAGGSDAPTSPPIVRWQVVS